MELERLLSDKLNEFNYELVSLTTRIEDGQKVLSLVVDRVEPIDMEAIVEITHVISDYLDENEPFPEPYVLDISSLGAEKPLKMEQLDKYVNRYVHVHLINPINGENIYEGDLVSLDENQITLSYKVKTRIKTVDIEKANISKIRLAIKF